MLVFAVYSVRLCGSLRQLPYYIYDAPETLISSFYYSACHRSIASLADNRGIRIRLGRHGRFLPSDDFFRHATAIIIIYTAHTPTPPTRRVSHTALAAVDHTLADSHYIKRLL